MLDQNGNAVALMAEELGSLGTEVGRQFLRTRRPFKATVFGPDGQQVIFTVRRPFYFINRCAGPARDVLNCVKVRWAAGNATGQLGLSTRLSPCIAPAAVIAGPETVT